MSQLPLVSGKKLIRLSCPGRKSVTVPNYREIDRSLLRKILRDAEISPEEFNELTG